LKFIQKQSTVDKIQSKDKEEVELLKDKIANTFRKIPSMMGFNIFEK